MDMRIDQVEVTERFRDASPADVGRLALSIAELGLLNPITVTRDGRLVAGLHRLRACEKLGWEFVPIAVVDLCELELQLAEIDENLIRNELTELERGEHLARRKQIYEMLHPETKHGANGGRGGKKNEGDKLSFSKEAAEKTGANERSIQRSVKRATAIPEDVRDAIRDTPIAKSGVELDALAKLPEEQQREVAQAVASGEVASVRKVHVTNNSGNNEWYTPEHIIEKARQVLIEIDLDPASCPEANDIVKAKRFYTADDNGLEQPWEGRVWLNPPYSGGLIEPFVDKLIESFENYDVSDAIVITNNATETLWFHKLVFVARAACFPEGRVRFWGSNGKSNSPLQGQTIFYLSHDDGGGLYQFAEVFSDVGWLALWDD